MENKDGYENELRGTRCIWTHLLNKWSNVVVEDDGMNRDELMKLYSMDKIKTSVVKACRNEVDQG